MTNHLVNENSPYLLQHVNNPVEWYPWGEEALRLAKEQGKPILLSIGYAACHWCHVMAHESFEDETTAALMNQHFVNIKVDREERPDLDSIYMDAVVAMTGQGGWPMTVILTPDGKPFFGGTYYPPTPRFGMPGFQQVLTAVADAWENRREEIQKNAAEVSGHIGRKIALVGDSRAIEPDVLLRAAQNISRRFDHRDGGFGPAPKFPQAMTIEYLLRLYQQMGDSHALYMAEYTLKKMAYGGMYDQIGGGFARYSTDSAWLVPHFEKMLYDNALLARVFLHAWQITGHDLYKGIVEETLDYVLREMRHPEGGFFSSLDADSEGEEGKFYVWDLAEIQEVLGLEADFFIEYYGVSAGGNWEGKNILNVRHELDELAGRHGLTSHMLKEKLASARQALYEVRATRVWPGLDDKVITAWNGLMLAAFAEAGSALNRTDYTQAAEENARFLYNTMRTEDSRLRRSWKSGSQAKTNAFLDDYANLAEGLLALYQNTFNQRWFTWARELSDRMIDHFLDEAGGFYDTPDDHEALIHRPKDVQDNAVPSGNAMAATVLLKLSLYTGERRYWEIVEPVVSSMRNSMVQAPTAFGQWLTAAAFILGEPQELAIVGERSAPDTIQLVDAARSAYRPNLLVACGPAADGEAIPLLAQRPMIDGRPTAYLCRRFVCKNPVTEPDLLGEQLTMDSGQ